MVLGGVGYVMGVAAVGGRSSSDGRLSHKSLCENSLYRLLLPSAFRILQEETKEVS